MLLTSSFPFLPATASIYSNRAERSMSEVQDTRAQIGSSDEIFSFILVCGFLARLLRLACAVGSFHPAALLPRTI